MEKRTVPRKIKERYRKNRTVPSKKRTVPWKNRTVPKYFGTFFFDGTILFQRMNYRTVLFLKLFFGTVLFT